MRKVHLLMSTICMFALGLMLSTTAHAQQKNVLLLMADDFNHWLPEIGYYPDAKTPNLSGLADKGVLFSRAYVASPVCSPSRNAMMSGLRPTTTGISSNGDGYIRDKAGFQNWVTMNQYFTQNGYYTYAGGKIYHPGSMNSNEADKNNWSGIYTGGSGAGGGSAYKWEIPVCGGPIKWSGGTGNVENDNDTKLARHMANQIRNYNRSKPFFMACGFFRPHLPWNCHKDFYDLFNPNQLTVPPPGYANIGSATCEHQQITGNNKWNEAIRAYLANMAYADFNVGIVLDALEQSGRANNTIVLFMGDHGWHLGEKKMWKKSFAWEHASHTTLIIYDPSANGNGRTSSKVVGLQDLYPTLVELCGLPRNNKVEGTSLVPLLNNPNLGSWNNAVLSKIRDTEYIRTQNWKFVEEGNNSQLYNALTEINEHNNLYGRSQYNGVVASLRFKMDSLKQLGQDIINGGPTPGGSTPIPGTVQAESFASQSGVQTENCSEGGLNVGWIDNGDWMDYDVDAASSGEYKVEFRVAALNSAIKFNLKKGSSVLTTVSSTATGGWQTWKTVSKNINLSAGEQTLRVQATGGGWNLNWIKFTKVTSTPPSGDAPIGKTITLTGNNGNYVCSENGTTAMNCNRTAAGAWEKFTVVDAGNGKVRYKIKENM